MPITAEQALILQKNALVFSQILNEKGHAVIILASYVGGLLLLTDRETEASHIVMVAQKIQRMGSIAYGVILRDFSAE